MIILNNVSFCYKKTKPILVDHSFGIKKGNILAITGENGSGKTTLLKIISGLLKQDSGEIIREKNLSISFIPPNLLEFLLPWYNVNQNLSFFISKGTSIKLKIDDYPEVKKYFELFETEKDLFNKKIFELSSGWQSILAVACALQFDSNIIIFDEIFAHTSHKYSNYICNCLSEHLINKNRAIIFTTHCFENISTFPTHVYDLQSKNTKILRS